MSGKRACRFIRIAILYLFNYFESYGTIQIVYFFVSQFGVTFHFEILDKTMVLY